MSLFSRLIVAEPAAQPEMHAAGSKAGRRKDNAQARIDARAAERVAREEAARKALVDGKAAEEMGVAAGKAGSFAALREPGKFEKFVAQAKRRFGKRFALEPGVALNAALAENLYVVVVCILNRIPAFVVGKPGSSKTLALQIIASNLQGARSPRPFWRRFPAVHLFPYQCSPMSTARGVREQFDMACRYQARAAGVRAVLLLDEVGGG